MRILIGPVHGVFATEGASPSNLGFPVSDAMFILRGAAQTAAQDAQPCVLDEASPRDGTLVLQRDEPGQCFLASSDSTKEVLMLCPQLEGL